ncbi:hypothetical protein AHAS_Ahas02G0063600 [Arachis hypogaea]
MGLEKSTRRKENSGGRNRMEDYQQNNHNPNMVWINQLTNNSRQWQEELVKIIFKTDIATEILQISISEDGEDSITWKWERNGHYSMASGYRIAFRFSHLPIQQFPEVCREKRVWNSLWELRCPPKVKVFLWKAIHGGLPIRHRLHNRLLTVEDVCPTMF